MTPTEKHLANIQNLGFENDETQLQAISHFQALYDRLTAGQGSKRNLVQRLFSTKKSEQTLGLYLWGGVGRGKTYLMDLFFETVPIKEKVRYHFHRYMLSVHDDLKSLRDTQDPLAVTAKRFASRYRLLCLDEFAVLEIGDAVILARLLKALINNNVVLVTTSNTCPNDLYTGGLQRDRFLPAIKLINQHTNVVKISEGIDYRLKSLSGKTLYHSPLGDESDKALENDYRQICDGGEEFASPLEILGRPIRTQRQTHNLVWFEFNDICDGPRSKADYIEIANCYRTVMISNIPVLTWELENQAHRFIQLIDEFYDHGVHLIVSAEQEPESLYTGKRFTKEFKRTASRLGEMQTNAYLSRIHGK